MGSKRKFDFDQFQKQQLEAGNFGSQDLDLYGPTNSNLEKTRENNSKF